MVLFLCAALMWCEILGVTSFDGFVKFLCLLIFFIEVIDWWCELPN